MECEYFESRHWLGNCEDQILLLGLIILNRTVHLVFLEPLTIYLTIVAPNLEVCASTFLIFCVSLETLLGVNVKGSGLWTEWRQTQWEKGLMEETVESTLEWKRKNCRLGAAGGPKIEAPRMLRSQTWKQRQCV